MARRYPLVRLIRHDANRGVNAACHTGLFTPDQSVLSRWSAMSDRGRFVRDEPAYRRIAELSFRVADRRVLHGICRIPSTELIMTLTPKPR